LNLVYQRLYQVSSAMFLWQQSLKTNTLLSEKFKGTGTGRRKNLYGQTDFHFLIVKINVHLIVSAYCQAGDLLKLAWNGAVECAAIWPCLLQG